MTSSDMLPNNAVNLVPRIHIRYIVSDEPDTTHETMITARTITEFETRFDMAYDEIWFGHRYTSHLVWMLWKQEFQQISEAIFRDMLQDAWLINPKGALTGLLSEAANEDKNDASSSDTDDALRLIDNNVRFSELIEGVSRALNMQPAELCDMPTNAIEAIMQCMLARGRKREPVMTESFHPKDWWKQSPEQLRMIAKLWIEGEAVDQLVKQWEQELSSSESTDMNTRVHSLIKSWQHRHPMRINEIEDLAVYHVTDTQTIFDGLSVVISAYGLSPKDIPWIAKHYDVSAQTGKSSFVLLAYNMALVVEVAARVRIGFDQVAAAFAALTAQGRPTAQAATQIRAALEQMENPESKVAKLFRKETGLDCQAYWDAGGTMRQSMKIVVRAAKARDRDLAKLFGRVEGAMGARGLTSEASRRTHHGYYISYKAER